MAVSVNELRETEAYVKVPSSGGGDHFSGVVTMKWVSDIWRSKPTFQVKETKDMIAQREQNF